jgi:hypothetical protein
MGIKTHSMLRLLLSCARQRDFCRFSKSRRLSLFACHSFYKPNQTFAVTAINQLYLLYILMIFSRFVNFLFLTSRAGKNWTLFVFIRRRRALISFEPFQRIRAGFCCYINFSCSIGYKCLHGHEQ